MIHSSALLADLKAQLRVLQADLKARADDATTEWGAALQREHAEALRRERTGLSWSAWRDNEVDQAAVAWIVATTFIRFCEDNDLLVGATLDGMPVPVGWIAGPGDRTARARENQTAYFRVHTSHHDRDWLQQAFRVLAAQPAGAALVDPKHNPVWTAEISAEAAKELLTFWRRAHDDGTLIHDFTDPDLDTRFLGDLYQDLSEHAKKTYALLQTPEFVEQFILDRTLTPAIAEFGIEGLRLIDPACGSGHFLLGAFERLNRQWASEAPAMNAKQRVRRAMDSIHGVDLNPFAIAIARFRLTVAGVVAQGAKSLVGVAPLGFHLAIGDSLLGEQGVQGELAMAVEATAERFTYHTEDVSEYQGILAGGGYHVVVGNPPYIAAADPKASEQYRGAYSTIYRKYTLAAPFMELFFRLALRGERGRGAGYIGQITSKSFLTRMFGKPVVEDLFASRIAGNPVDLSLIVDSSGAWMPGHNFEGTTTVLIFGRRRLPIGETVRAVLGIVGDAARPEEPARGPVWTEIVEHVDDPGFIGSYVSVSDIERAALTSHPVSLSGGGADKVVDRIESATSSRVNGRAHRIGFFGVPGADDAFLVSSSVVLQTGEGDAYRPLVVGDQVRDYVISGAEPAFVPYTPANELRPLSDFPESARRIWPLRTELGNRATFAKRTYFSEGRPWYEWHQMPKDDGAHPWALTFAEVATHNHFVLTRGQSAFKQTAPIVKMPAEASEESFTALLAVLNSSTACFWLKEVSYAKDKNSAAWATRYQFNSSNIGRFPLPRDMSVMSKRGAVLDALSRDLSAATPEAVLAECFSTGSSGSLSRAIQAASVRWSILRGRLVFEQEELDWETYRLYGLLDEDLTYHGEAVDQIGLGERSFEVALARHVQAGGEETAWFDRHGSTPLCDLPTVWPADYRELVEKRLAVMASDGNIRLLERPEYKRRWATVPWERQLEDALESAILDRLEEQSLWVDSQGPTARSVAQLADLLRSDQVMRDLACALTGNVEPELTAVVESLALREAVPYLAAHRYKPSGLEKFREWQSVWDLQRREDAGEKVTIPVPPKYAIADFQRVECWKARGKLDVPKERFVLYPGVGREGDTSPVLGWAGWNHRDQAVALVREILTQQALGASDEALVPMVAGLVELEPWLHQWHTDLEPEFGSSAAQAVTSQIDQLLAHLQMTRDDVNDWRPPAATRGRRRRT
ncbi:BREX-2 system adenine-specific DNA-methyltransferase PglX [Cellulomonas sp. GbtcB1]|uniref:BREX-2 system adenine-specific DNA-methyltransferase PglX n=1 Tax=Cellulomonas sp. GbtcB1 TaxID=2824746 RepID=UPI001C2F2A32|nr:BREX-2 system adenine-specific DNA-methyltransferase PglX [Cellulomonas sp. GbtcB1]